MCRKILTFCLLSLSAVITAGRLEGEGVLRGEKASPNQFPYQVALLLDNNDKSYFCGGGILDDDHILTAAHCFVDRETNQFYGKAIFLYAGTNDLANAKKDGIKVKVEKIYVPLVYDARNFQGKGDVAVLKLKKSLKLKKNKNLKQLNLPKNLQETYANKEAKVAGFGWNWSNPVQDPKTKEWTQNGGATDRKLKYLNVDVLGITQCHLYNQRKSVTDDHLCGKSKQRDVKKSSGVCTGDSGGPLVHNGDTVIGVLSYTSMGCTDSSLPAVYTRVSSYLNFIEAARKDEFSDKTMRMYAFKSSSWFNKIFSNKSKN